MTISEACQLWIDQRCHEELAERERSYTPKSLRAIGKEIAAEIIRYFEASIAPETIRKRLERMQEGGTNVPPEPSDSEDEGNQENQSDSQVIKAHHPPRHWHKPTGQPKGGPRERAGRKPKNEPRKEVNEDEERLFGAYNHFLAEVTAAKTNQWKNISKTKVIRFIENLIVLIEA